MKLKAHLTNDGMNTPTSQRLVIQVPTIDVDLLPEVFRMGMDTPSFLTYTAFVTSSEEAVEAVKDFRVALSMEYNCHHSSIMTEWV